MRTLSSFFITCDKMPCLPRNLHIATTSHSADNAIPKNQATRDCCACHAKMTSEIIGGLQSAAPAMKNATLLLKAWQEYCACHTKQFYTRLETCWNVTKCHAWKPQKFFKVIPFAEVTIGAAIRPSHERLRAVADVIANIRKHC